MGMKKGLTNSILSGICCTRGWCNRCSRRLSSLDVSSQLLHGLTVDVEQAQAILWGELCLQVLGHLEALWGRSVLAIKPSYRLRMLTKMLTIWPRPMKA